MLLILGCIVVFFLAAADFNYAKRDLSTLNAISCDIDSPPSAPGSVVFNNGHICTSLNRPPMVGGRQ
jgi:hypothetical protein